MSDVDGAVPMEHKAKHYHKNPRSIGKKEFENLRATLRELGDLSGVVLDLNSGEIIGGNQRMEVFDLNQCEIQYTVKLKSPDEQGTKALGFVIWEGKRYNYREVRWTPEQCEKANIIANKAGGTWDFDILANQFEIPDLIEWGFKPYELGIPGADGVDDPNTEWKGMPEFEQENNSAFKTIKVHFFSQGDVDNFAELVGQKITAKTISINYPFRERADILNMRVSDEP